jgi:hypothetical protein
MQWMCHRYHNGGQSDSAISVTGLQVDSKIVSGIAEYPAVAAIVSSPAYRAPQMAIRSFISFNSERRANNNTEIGAIREK